MLSDEEFLRISTYMKQRYGIDLSQKKIIINGRLENYIRKGGWKSFNEFMNAVENDATGNQEKMLVNFLTTNHTYFMREFEHFDYFRKVVLPWLKTKESRTKDLRIWCGAASSGEEPYMIAMVLSDFFGLEREQWDTKILATDISTKVLQKAIAGVYNEEQLDKLPDQWKRHFFKHTKGSDQYVVTDELKREVIFRQFNLMDPLPFRKKLHTVFLRNVMIYFDDATKKDLVQRVYDVMEPGGYLFIGTTETLDRSSTPFQIIQPSIFRK
ncbi:MAG: protein-glutamate O-methyltransferase CheR [Lachnoclostridium sp.]|nr:protein-glutamate O-methyltransferase CheR [Lachnospira sp.]MCM1247700.1 protein-glutamate O-methyltransferase CheR [Lachnoclostridium sp.]MCM1536371.1 protein-glutamate O-methyltransferase CheR [Clostridium sp.]